MPEGTPETTPADFAPTVTFLMTDVEGSTRLLARDERGTTEMLLAHQRLIGEITRRLGGRYVKGRGEGDSTFSAFTAARSAVEAACEIQIELLRQIPSLSVRVAVNTGEVEYRDDDYFGAAVNRCQRLRAIGYGGQVLLSGTTESIVYDRLPSGATLKDLGEHPLRDFERPERVFQLMHDDLPDSFAQLRTLDSAGNPVEAGSVQVREALPPSARSAPSPVEVQEVADTNVQEVRDGSGSQDHGVTAYLVTLKLLELNRHVAVRGALRRDGARLLAASSEWVTSNKSQTSVPSQVSDGKKVASWEPVYGPILRATETELRTFMGASAACCEYQALEVAEVADVLVRLFESAHPAAASFTWVGNAPRLLARLAADFLLGCSLAIRNWRSFQMLTAPRLTSYRGRRPWQLHPEYQHLDSLGGDALVSGRWVEAMLSTDVLADELGLSSSALIGGVADANVLLGIVGAAVDPKGRDEYVWGLAVPGRLGILRNLAESDEGINTLAALANEPSVDFRRNFGARLARLRRVMFLSHPMGDWDLSDEQVALVRAIEEAKE